MTTRRDNIAWLTEVNAAVMLADDQELDPRWAPSIDWLRPTRSPRTSVRGGGPTAGRCTAVAPWPV